MAAQCCRNDDIVRYSNWRVILANIEILLSKAGSDRVVEEKEAITDSIGDLSSPKIDNGTTTNNNQQIQTPIFLTQKSKFSKERTYSGWQNEIDETCENTYQSFRQYVTGDTK